MIFESDNLDNNFVMKENINNYQDEIDYYKNIFSDNAVTPDDYTFVDNVIRPGVNKHSWTYEKFYIPIKINKKVIPIEFELMIYNKSPLFTIICNQKDELYEKYNHVVNVWPYLHQRKFLRKQIRMTTKTSPTIDMLDYPLTFTHNENWRHLHSDLHLLSRKQISVDETKVHNYTGNIFRWSVHKYTKKQENFLLMILTYEFLSYSRRQKIIRSCALGLFDGLLTEWINNGAIEDR